MIYPYTDIETAPMFYFKLLRVMMYPGLIVRLGRLIYYVNEQWGLYVILFTGADVMLHISMMYGFLKMKWSGVDALLGKSALQILDGAVAMFIVPDYDVFTYGWSRILAGILVFAIHWTYFKKRRLLFSPAPPDSKAAQMKPSPGADMDPTDSEAAAPIEETRSALWKGEGTEGEESPRRQEQAWQVIVSSELRGGAEGEKNGPPRVAYCRKCGKMLLPDSRFCSFCGSDVIRGGRENVLP